MKARRILTLAAAALALAACGRSGATLPDETATVARVGDGDTLDLTDGRRVRLLQIDATELGSGECYSRRATEILRRLLPAGTEVRLEADAGLDDTDRYGRLLRYVFRGGQNVNLELVRRGAASVWLVGGRGLHADELLDAAEAARAERRGLWGACRVVWDPAGPARAEP